MLTTIAMTVYGEFPNAWFTTQALREYHGTGFDLLVIDASPKGCISTRNAVLASGGRYYRRPDLTSTSSGRDQLIRLARTPWVIVIDPHVLLAQGAVKRFEALVESSEHDHDILTGPLVHDDGQSVSTHWAPNGPGRLWGTWATDKAGMATGRPFEIPASGLGLFAVHRDHWPGFHPHHKGFGAEEHYIHELYRRNGGRVLCVPGLGWRHQFRGPANPAPYPRPPLDHPRNLLLHHRELGLDSPETVAIIRQQFAVGVSDEQWQAMVEAVHAVQPQGVMSPRPSRQRLLGVWYSNNAAPAQLLVNSLDTIRLAAESSRHAVTIVTCPHRPVEGNPFREVLADLGGATGHSAIVRQIAQCLGEAGEGFDAVVFLEQDVLYGPDHFDAIGDAFSQNPDCPVVSNLNYEGLNGTGWLAVRERHEPLHQLAMRFPQALANLYRAAQDCGKQGWAYLEPDHDADRSKWFRLPPDLAPGQAGRMPSIHVNHTQGRLTSHGEVVFAKTGKADHPFWGDFRQWWPETVSPGCVPCKQATRWVQTIDEMYEAALTKPSDFRDHMGTLRSLASEAKHVSEVSGWNKPALIALAAGCTGLVRSYCTPPSPKAEYQDLTRLLGDRFRGEVLNPIDKEIEETDLLFLDVWHDGESVEQLLTAHAPRVRGRIVLHCTDTYGERGESGGEGMIAGITRFLRQYPEWTVVRQDKESHGLMVLSKLNADKDRVPGLGSQLITFGKAVMKHAADGAKPAPTAVKEARLALCMVCPHRVDERCGKCGCPVESKTGWASESCPDDPPRWGRV